MKKQIMSKRGRRFDEGGEVQNMPRARTAAEDREAEDKASGLEASNKEKPMGFFERLRAGNIDDPTSEAYKRFGAGRGRADRAANIPVEDKSFTALADPSKDVPVINNRAKDMANTYAAVQAGENAKAAALGAGKRQPSGDASVAEAMASMPDRMPSSRPNVSARPRPAKKEFDPTAGEAKNSEDQDAADKITDPNKVKPAAKPAETASKPKKDMYRNFSGKMVEKTPDIASPMAGLGSLIGRGAKAMGEAYDKYEFMTPAKRIAKENKEKKEARGYKSGGSVASSRADGIAQRGKTRGKMC